MKRTLGFCFYSVPEDVRFKDMTFSRIFPSISFFLFNPLSLKGQCSTHNWEMEGRFERKRQLCNDWVGCGMKREKCLCCSEPQRIKEIQAFGTELFLDNRLGSEVVEMGSWCRSLKSTAWVWWRSCNIHTTPSTPESLSCALPCDLNMENGTRHLLCLNLML